jgi:hypothetical protein
VTVENLPLSPQPSDPDHAVHHGIIHKHVQVPTSAAVRYVTVDGNNANSGLSWGDSLADLNAAVDDLPAGGGTIYLGAGVYNGRWYIDKDDVTVIGAGRGTDGTVLRLPDGVDVPAQTLTISGDRAVVRNVRIDGNRANNADESDGYSDGIGVYADYTLVADCWITGARSHGYIVWGDPTGAHSNGTSRTVGRRLGNRLIGCVVEQTGNATNPRAAVDFATLNTNNPKPEGWVVAGCTIYQDTNALTCLTTHTSARGLIHGNTFYGRQRTISLHTQSEDITVTDNQFYADGSHTFCIQLLNGTRRITIANNRFSGRNWDQTNTNRYREAVWVASSDVTDVTIQGNVHHDPTSFADTALVLLAAGGRVQVLGNTLLGSTHNSAYFVRVGSGTPTTEQVKVRHNRGVNVAGVLSGAGAVDEFDNFGAGSGTATDSLVPNPESEPDGRILVTESGELVYTDLPSGNGGTVSAKNSIEVDDGDLQLVGDVPSPAADRYYGTNGTGTLGFHPVPEGGEGGGGGVDNLARLAADPSLGWRPGTYKTGATSIQLTAQTAGPNFIRFGRPLFVTESLTVDRIALSVVTAGVSGAEARLGIYSTDEYGRPQTLVADCGTVAVDSAGTKELTIDVQLGVGVYCAGVVSSDTYSYRAAQFQPPVDINVSGLNASMSWQATHTFGALPSSPTVIASTGTVNPPLITVRRQA